MKKKIFPIIAVITTAAITLTLASCGSNTANGNDPNGQGYQRPDLMGQVTAIAGNEVTIKVIELPAMPSFSPGQRSPRPSGWQRSPRPSDAAQQTPAPDASAAPGSSPAPDGSPLPSGSQDGRRGFSMNFTGEEKTIVIPVGVPITQTTRTFTGTAGNNGGNSNNPNNGGNIPNNGNSRPQVSTQTVTLDFKDIKVGDIISVWYSAKDKTAIARVSIQSTTTNGGNGGFPGGFPGGGFPGGPGGQGGQGRD